jgi:outer membrane protein OmpA-like peptidoglycan-associated protein
MITAEPYYSVTIPSDVVVAENVVRPDTIGAREAVTAKYELLPRGQYTMNVQAAQLRSMEGYGEKLSYDRYEAVLELYQAENAVQIAQSSGAGQYASESMSKAAALLSKAQDMNARKMDTHAIVSAARESAQMAEDARTIAVKRQDEERRQQEIRRSENQSELRRRAEEDDAQARADREAEAQQAAAEVREEAAKAQAAQQAVVIPPRPPAVENARAQNPNPSQKQFRAQLLAQLNGTITTRDTPRGLVVIVNDSMFGSGNDDLRPDAAQRLGDIARVVASRPGLTVRVEGYADVEGLSEERAQAVRSAMIARGARPDSIVAVGYGKSRPIASNATASGREQNRRVEVVISGDSIGNQALWDQPYSLRSRR